MLTGGVCNVFFAAKYGHLAIGGSHTAPAALLSPCAIQKAPTKPVLLLASGATGPKKQ